ncbi:MAG TPA: HDOD domain-containing protein [Steroidobacteraceae bacterium]|jgi:HD-like signal output (HDOD) protein|nr:HDOD domain-containing protein [Steroidobacteraceae bacterium]
MSAEATSITSTVEARALPNTVVFSFVKGLAAELSQGQVELPSVPDIVIRLQQTLSDDNVTNEVVVRVVGSEPMLAGKLLTMANSVALNTSGRKIADLRTAVARVGFNIVRSAALSFAMEQLRKASEFRHLESQLDVLWKNSVQIAAMCHVIARRFSSLNGDTALLAGLMHNVGRIYILTRASKYPTLTADPLTFNSIVRDWHANVAKALLENWRVAEEIVEAVAGYEDLDREARGPVTLTDVLSLAMLLERNRNGSEMNVPDEGLIKGLKRMQLQVRDCHAVLDESAEEIAALKSALGG